MLPKHAWSDSNVVAEHVQDRNLVLHVQAIPQFFFCQYSSDKIGYEIVYEITYIYST